MAWIISRKNMYVKKNLSKNDKNILSIVTAHGSGVDYLVIDDIYIFIDRLNKNL
jgi:hypothetical protein